MDVESEQPKTPVQEERRSFFEPRSAASSAAAAAPAPMSIFDDDVNEAPTTPRGSPTTRAFGDEPEGHDSKRARTASSKKQRIERVAEQYEAAIRMVKVSAQEEFHTMDDYNTHLQLDDQDEVDIWAGEENVSTSHMTAKLWSNHDVSQQPPEPDPEVDKLADDVEMKRFLEMGVLVRACDYGKEVMEKLTTKCVYDWRLHDKC